MIMAMFMGPTLRSLKVSLNLHLLMISGRPLKNSLTCLQAYQIQREFGNGGFSGKWKTAVPGAWRMEDAKEKNQLSFLYRQLRLHWPWGGWGREREKCLLFLSPFSNSFSKTGQWSPRRRLRPAKTLLKYDFPSGPDANSGHMDGSTLDLRQVFIFFFSYVKYAHERFLSIE